METTCWTLIAGAAKGEGAERQEFARRYASVLRAYFAHRWRDRLSALDTDDAMQEVFLECFRSGGALEKARPGGSGGFRAYLYGLARHVALRIETRRAKASRRHEDLDLGAIRDDEASPSQAFDRAWAQALVREAAVLMGARAERKGEAAMRRVELLRLRFADGLPIREIAARWGMKAEALYQDQLRGRREFKDALRTVVAFHNPGNDEEIDQECTRLHELLRVG
jgi:RNA polymerase sigma-70 factor (ECF subfamily)